MLGLGGTVVSLSQVLLFERGVLASMEWNWKIVLYLCGYVLCLVAMYVITALFLQWNDAVVFNMHLLTSDIIAAVLTYFFFDDVSVWGECMRRSRQRWCTSSLWRSPLWAWFCTTASSR